MAQEKELLFEIGTEEIPSVYLSHALRELEQVAGRLFQQARLAHQGLRCLGTPRRLTLIIDRLADRQADERREVIGPPKAAAYGPDGKPTKAAHGFAKSQGVTAGQLKVKATDRGEYVVALQEFKGERATALLPALLPRIVRELDFPKMMRWGEGTIRFVRPLRWLLALYGGRVIPFTLDGVESGDRSRGHRFLSPKPFRVKSVTAYRTELRKRHVIVDPAERHQVIADAVEAAARAVGGKALLDPGLLEEVAHLVELPTVLRGEFPESYLLLPREVIITPMRKHQRYFPVLDRQGNLLPSFIAVSNMQAKEMGLIRAGNERVLRARLADADFYFQEDKRRLPMTGWVPRLDQVLYQERLGSIGDKVRRLADLAAFLCEHSVPELLEEARRASLLCKADLVSGMIREFPELQGVMGRIYAELDGERATVAEAIEEHYLPRTASDRLPKSRLGAILAVADRLDTMAGCFGIGLVPTGSEDPYALRRAATGVVLILLEGRVQGLLSAIVRKAVDLVRPRMTRPVEPVVGDILEFLRARQQSLLVERGVPPDVVEAVLAVDSDRVDQVGRRAAALAAFRQEADFAELAAAFRRVVNILGKLPSSPVDPSLFTETAEAGLYEAAHRLREQVDPLLQQERYAEALRQMAGIRPVIDRFFDAVLVMAEDPTIRDNRLALLHQVAGMFGRLADFSKLKL
ncbi:MAG: glycine--tRNA ligase subunit beta [Candidatus Methylomirabilales bacterium]